MKKLLFFLISVLLVHSVYAAVNTIPETYDLYKTRPIAADNTISHYKYAPGFFINPHGVYAYDRVQPAEKTKRDFYGTMSYQERAQRDLALREEARLNRGAALSLQRSQRFEIIDQIYGHLARATEEDVLEETENNLKFSRHSTNYIPDYVPVYRLGESNVYDEHLKESIRVNAMKRRDMYGQLLDAYASSLKLKDDPSDPYRVATNIFPYSGNKRLVQRKVLPYSPDFAPYSSELFFPYTESMMGSNRNI